MRLPMRYAALFLLLLTHGIASAQTPTTLPAEWDGSTGWMPLFNGRNLDNFYTFRNAEGKNNDSQHVFKVENGMLHILDMPDTIKMQPAGYMATNDEFRNYRLRLEYKWGTKKYPVPRHPQGIPRDTGLLHHIYGPDRAWPQCVEFQIQEHNTGDIWLLDVEPRPHATITAATTQPGPGDMYTYQSGGVPVDVPVRPGAQRVFHSAEYESLTNWNTVELYSTEDQAVQVVNGHVNNAAKNIRMGKDGPPVIQGRIALQAEFSEVYFRNVQIKPLFAVYGGPSYKVLVFSKTTGFRHASIPDGIEAIKELGSENHFSVDATEDASAFTQDNLRQYKAVIFLSTTGVVLNDAQRQAMENYIHGGGGFVGIHAASDTEYSWPWYGKLVGAWFSNHPPGTHPATVRLEDADDPSTSSLPLTWTRTDEWYNFRTNPRDSGVHVLATLDESTYAGGTMHGDHPISWRHEFDGGRSWYTAMGHTKESYHDPLFLFHLLGGIEYAAQTDGMPPTGAAVLFDGRDASHWIGRNGNPLAWPVYDGSLESKTRAGDIVSKETFNDFQLHVEFKCPAVIPPHTGNATTNEQAMGNSGVYLQGHYEMQILDSFDHPLKDMNDNGAVYGAKDADMNASQPAETWQTYDILFHAARWHGGAKTANARVTAWLNGMLIQNDVEIPQSTTNGIPEAPGPGPIMLQEHLNPVLFRNIWVVPL
jgi:type 1 glutamine amidotransferase